MTRAATLALVVVVGCGGRGEPKATSPVDARSDPQPDRTALIRDLEATVLENYSQLTLGNFDAYRDGVASEDPVVLFGVSPRDVVYGISPPGLSRDRRPYRRFKPTIYSKNLDLHLSKDGSVAWVYDEISYRVPYMGRTASIPIRVTGLYVRDVDRWVLVMEHQSYAIPTEDIVRFAVTGQLRQPGEMRKRYNRRDGPSPLVLKIAGRFHNADENYRKRKLSTEPDALILLPDPDHEYRGKHVAEAPTLASLFGDSATVGLRDYRVHVSRNKRVAWMAANLVVRTTINGDEVEVGLRATYVFENRGEWGWEVVQLHVSVPVHLRELTRRIFGTVRSPQE